MKVNTTLTTLDIGSDTIECSMIYITKIINKNERYDFLETEQKIVYNYDDSRVSKIVEYYYAFNESNGKIFYKNQKESTIVEKFIMNYDTNVFTCLTNECPGKENLLNKIAKYQSLLSVE